MPKLRTFIYAFWAFVIIMLLWQAYQYNAGLSEQVAHPEQQHFYFYDTNSVYNAPPVVHAGPYVRQTAYSVTQNKPIPGNFTCHVTLKNEGQTKAINVQVQVRPYRGGHGDNDTTGDLINRNVDDNSALAQYGQWVSFPDLAPGESSTQDVTFDAKPNVPTGPNPDPQIMCDPAPNAPAGHAP